MKKKRQQRIFISKCSITFLLCIVGLVDAAIVNTTGSVETVIQELVDGTVASTSSATDTLNTDQSNFPLLASGELTTTDLDGTSLSLGQGFSQFLDPTRLNQPNPESFALEVSSYSNAADTAYVVTSTASETRTVLFAGPDNPTLQAEIQFDDDLTREILSRVYLSGAVVLWSTDDDVNLNGLMADITVTITNGATGEILFGTTLSVDVNTGGAVNATTTGDIRVQQVNINAFINSQVDDDTANILDEVEENGTLIILTIPQQFHNYTYTVTADTPFLLTANLEMTVRNAPGGTGVAATLGRPFENLAEFIEEGLPGVDGETIEKTINGEINQSLAGLDDKPEGQTLPGDSFCGAFGVELMIFGLLFLSLRLVPGFRRQF